MLTMLSDSADNIADLDTGVWDNRQRAGRAGGNVLNHVRVSSLGYLSRRTRGTEFLVRSNPTVAGRIIWRVSDFAFRCPTLLLLTLSPLLLTAGNIPTVRATAA